MTAPATVPAPVAALSLGRTSLGFHRVRGPAERLAERLINECRDRDAQIILDLLDSHRRQRSTLTGYHDSLQRALRSQQQTAQ